MHFLGGRFLDVFVAPAAQHGGAGRDQAGDDREQEGRVQAVAEGRGDQVGEEGMAGEDRLGVCAQPAQRVGPYKLLDRVVAEEGGEQDRDRRRMCDASCDIRGQPVGLQPGLCGCRQARGKADYQQVKKIPTESTWAEFWKVWFMPPPAPRSPAGRLFITAARLGEANIPIEMPVSNSTSANTQ